MAKVIVVYYSKGGNTRKMAECIGEAVRANGVDCDVKPVARVKVDALKKYDGIILGSPTYYGHPAAELKALIDESVKLHKQLTGKVGGAFASCGVLGGGGETTIRALLDVLLIHGMIVQGTASGSHYGPMAVGEPDEIVQNRCSALGERVANLVKKLS